MTDHHTHHRKGRGALSNPDARFEADRHVAFDDDHDYDQSVPATTLTPDHARSIISRNDSPDIPFEQSINPYRGCEHGCVYCFARPSHEYLGLSCGLDFETRLFHKPNAAKLLHEELSARAYRCKPIALGVNTDAYQPSERKLGITRQLLEIMREFRQPVNIVTKSALVERDTDILADMADHNLVHVMVSVTTLDKDLARLMEPRATAPPRRLAAMRALADAGVPVGMLFAPLIPALNEPEMETLLEAAAQAGAESAGYVILRLPHGIKDLFRDWLEQHYPLKARHVMSVVQSLHGGKDYDAQWGQRMRGRGPFADLMAQRFAAQCRKLGLNATRRQLDGTRFHVPVAAGGQLGLW
ncbi:MAG: PA0069 family radical SAM protein [Gammaproteobacteria bacterium]|nr:PA0069 family radical SAM protein [Gammaproteobacteria bacterium]